MVHPKVIDQPLSALVAKLPQSLTPFMRNVSIFGGAFYAGLVLTASLAWGLISNEEGFLTYLMLTVLFAPLAEMLKFITRRSRPETLYAENMKFKSYSFPSGHSYVSALMAGFIGVTAVAVVGGTLGWLIAVAAILFSGLIGVSRVFLGAHFPTDVIAGWMLGAVMTYVITSIHTGLF